MPLFPRYLLDSAPMHASVHEAALADLMICDPSRKCAATTALREHWLAGGLDRVTAWKRRAGAVPLVAIGITRLFAHYKAATKPLHRVGLVAVMILSFAMFIIGAGFFTLVGHEGRSSQSHLDSQRAF